MCIFSGPVEDVSQTKIFARVNSHGYQALAYQMTVSAREPVAMVLPLPVKLGQSDYDPQTEVIQFVDLSIFPDFFRKIEEPFAMKSRSLDKSVDTLRVDTIKVHDVGDFIASCVPNLSHFARLDPRFIMPRAAMNHPAYENYSFAVFQLKQTGHKEIHPMALFFPTRDATKLFFPTMHVHDGTMPQKERFDHALYAQQEFPRYVADGDFTEKQWQDKYWDASTVMPANSFMDTDRTRGIVAPHLKVFKKTMRGMLKNEDTLMSLVA